MANESGDINKESLRLLKILEELVAHGAGGIAEDDLGQAVNAGPPEVKQAIRILIANGWVTRNAETRHFHLTRAFVQLASRVRNNFFM